MRLSVYVHLHIFLNVQIRYILKMRVEIRSEVPFLTHNEMQMRIEEIRGLRKEIYVINSKIYFFFIFMITKK